MKRSSYQLLAMESNISGGRKRHFLRKCLIPLGDFWQGQLRPEHTFGNRGRCWCEAETLHQLSAVDRTFQGGSKTPFPQKVLDPAWRLLTRSAAPRAHIRQQGEVLMRSWNSSSTFSCGSNISGGVENAISSERLEPAWRFLTKSAAPRAHIRQQGEVLMRSWNSSSTFSCGSNISGGSKTPFPQKVLDPAWRLLTRSAAPRATFGNRGRSWCEAETLHQLLAVDRTFQGGSKTPFPQKGLIPLGDFWQGQLRPEHTFGNRGRSWCEAETLHQLLAVDRTFQGGSKTPFPQKGLSPLGDFWQGQLRPEHTFGNRGRSWCEAETLHQLLAVDRTFQGGSKTPFPQKGLIPLGDFWQGQLRPEHTFGNRGRSWCEAETHHQFLAMDRTFQGGWKRHFLRKAWSRLATFDKVSCAPSTHSATGGGPDAMLKLIINF